MLIIYQNIFYFRGEKVVDLWGRKGDDVKGSNGRLYDGESVQVFIYLYITYLYICVV